MAAWASGMVIGVGKLTRPLRGVGVLAMPDARLDTMQCGESVCEIPLGAGGVPRLLPGVGVGELIYHHSAEN
jgi:hypothetical protein